VVGMAHRLPDQESAAAVHERAIPRWAPGDDGHVVAVSTELVSGRRIHPDGNSPS